jgi:hypothetical protein
MNQVPEIRHDPQVGAANPFPGLQPVAQEQAQHGLYYYFQQGDAFYIGKKMIEVFVQGGEPVPLVEFVYEWKNGAWSDDLDPEFYFTGVNEGDRFWTVGPPPPPPPAAKRGRSRTPSSQRRSGKRRVARGGRRRTMKKVTRRR